jgi:uncharacterized protein YdhG (YjbR/CyaY superfamily)
MSKQTARDFDDYARRFPTDVQRLLVQMRQAIQAAAPEATASISYDMPAFRLDGMLVSFAAHTGHIGFYPGAAAIATFREELSQYKSAKGSVQFPFGEPLPLKLIARIVKFRVGEHHTEPKTRSRKR